MEMIIGPVNHAYDRGSVFTEAMLSKQPEKNQAQMASWFTGAKAFSEMVVGTVQ